MGALRLGVLFICLSFVVLSGCRKSDDYLYHLDAPVEVKATHKLKNLIGSSAVDMLWVIDNSGSMDPYQAGIKANTSLFIDSLASGSAINWKIGLISTDTGDNPYTGLTQQDILNATSANPVGQFVSAVAKLGTGGSPTEKTYEPIIKALTNNPSFLRDNSILAIILVSDAPEQSVVSTQEFLAFLKQIKGDLKNVLFYGVLGANDWCTPTDDTWSWAGSRFEELSRSVKTATYPICDPNYGKTLSAIGTDLGKHVKSPKIFLQARPKQNTLKVSYHGRPVPGGSRAEGGYWYLNSDENSVVFHNLDFAPGDNEEVEVSYEPDDGKFIP